MLVDGRKIRDDIIVELGTVLKGKSVLFLQFGTSVVSEQFVRVKTKIAERLGVKSEYVSKDILSTEHAIQALQMELKKHYDGIVVQLPLPKTIDADSVLQKIPVELDIDLITTEGKDRFKRGLISRIPPVVFAIVEILKRHNIDLARKKILVLGMGALVGEPLMQYFEREKISADVAVKETPAEQKKQLLKNADVVISGIGAPYEIKPEMVKRGAILIDAGTSEQKEKVVGDFHPSCAEKAALFTPVPGGVGPVTVIGLYKNLLLK